MTRRTWSAVLALSLAGGVYLAAAPAQASNMGFKLERNFDFKRTSAPGNAPLRNLYYVSFPLFNGLGDVADGVTTNPLTPGLRYADVCVGDPEGPPGPAGDGLINAFDAVCDLWTDRSNPSGGVFQFSYYDTTTCQIGQVGGQRRLGHPDFGASTAFPPAGTDLWTDIGYLVSVAGQGAFPDPHNRAVIVGSHDPAFAGHTIHFSRTCGTAAPRVDLVAIPYHTMWQKSVEILCGLRGVAWSDAADNNWQPDDPAPAGFGVCNGGIFDDQIGTGHTIQVSTFKVEDPALGGANGLVTQVAKRSNIRFSLSPADPPFDLIPGEAYLVGISQDHIDTILRSPHF